MFTESAHLVSLFKEHTVEVTTPDADPLTEYVITSRWDEDSILRGGPLYYLWTRDVGTEHNGLVFTGFSYHSISEAQDAVECFLYKYDSTSIDEINERIEESRHRYNETNGDPYGQDQWM